MSLWSSMLVTVATTPLDTRDELEAWAVERGTSPKIGVPVMSKTVYVRIIYVSCFASVFAAHY